MISLRRKAAKSAERLPTFFRQRIRQYSSAGHGKIGDHGHHSRGAHGHHEGPTSESLGPAFYIVLAAIPASLAVYAASRTSSDGKVPGFSTFIDSYSYYKERWAARNTLHTAMIQQAAFDRNLYHSSEGSQHVNLKFPEIFNTGSPHNVSAGHGPRNMDKLVAHYEKANADEEDRKAKALANKER